MTLIVSHLAIIRPLQADSTSDEVVRIRSMKQKAFTLIELLVVIAIIAILAAILFPVFAQAKAAAKKTATLSNEKQVSLGIMMYMGDSDDTYPMDQYYQGPDQVRWFDSVYPYIKNGTKFQFNGRASGAGGVFAVAGVTEQEAIFGVHGGLFPDGGNCPWINSATTKTVSATAVDTPAERVILLEKGLNKGNSSWLTFISDEWGYQDTVGNPAGSVDGHHWDIDHSINRDCDFAGSNAYDPTQWDTYAQCGSFARYRHTDTANMAYGDGHVKSVKRGALSWFKNVYVPGVTNEPY
ncbi:hypothetical protein BH11ARM2_BH11ARM2_08960 [soil metagenome]